MTGLSGKFAKNSKNKKKGRPSFEELLAKYEKKGITQKQKRQSSEAKDTKPSPGHREQSDSHPCQGNHAAVPYSFGEPVAPWFWSYPCYYTPLDYGRMHMQLYFIQYSSTYSNYGTSQRMIVTSNNLVESNLG